jgi:hypothetical protein
MLVKLHYRVNKTSLNKMMINPNNLLEFYMFFPLDQFGDDECYVGLLDNMLTDLIPGIDYVEDLLDFIRTNQPSSIGG